MLWWNERNSDLAEVERAVVVVVVVVDDDGVVAVDVMEIVAVVVMAVVAVDVVCDVDGHTAGKDTDTRRKNPVD